jgi:hypothetical protein
MKIEDVIEKLKDKAVISIYGKSGTEVLVDKELLNIASIYLEDYLCMLETYEMKNRINED